MHIERKKKPLVWGELDVALFAAAKDWYGEPLQIPVGFSFAIDEKSLWFIASHRQPASLHPDARPGRFQPELWKYDVAEFFLTNPENGRYLEFNLAPNGAWWAAEFSGPREGMGEAPLQGVSTYSELAANGAWIAAAKLELTMLRERFAFSPDSRLNATFILESPAQRFISVADLGKGEPDFHQPELFPLVQFIHEDELAKLMS